MPGIPSGRLWKYRASNIDRRTKGRHFRNARTATCGLRKWRPSGESFCTEARKRENVIRNIRGPSPESMRAFVSILSGKESPSNPMNNGTAELLPFFRLGGTQRSLTRAAAWLATGAAQLACMCPRSGARIGAGCTAANLADRAPPKGFAAASSLVWSTPNSRGR